MDKGNARVCGGVTGESQCSTTRNDEKMGVAIWVCEAGL